MTQQDPVAFLDPDTAFSRGLVDRAPFPKDCRPIDQYEIEGKDLGQYPGIVVSSQADQEFLLNHRALVETYLDRGGVVAFSGHLCTPWLPGAAPFQAKTIRSHQDYHVARVHDHPIFEGVQAEHLTYQKGVAGFFARGHHPPPPGAETLVHLEGGEPVVYVDTTTTPGTILVHSGNDLIGFARRNTSAARIPQQMIDWMRTVSDLEGGR